jgi:signal transduction histidine kinase
MDVPVHILDVITRQSSHGRLRFGRWLVRPLGLRIMLRSGVDATRSFWFNLSLSTQFLVAASAVLVTAMALLGAWVSAQIEQRVVQNTAVTTAFYMDSLIEPSLQALAAGDELDVNAVKDLDRLLGQTLLGKSIATAKIWNMAGQVLYSTTKEQIGTRYPETPGFKTAITNQVAAEFDDLGAAENLEERRFKRPLLEVYSPIHEHGTDRVIAVAELYQFGDGLRADLIKTRWTTFIVVGTSTLGMLALLFRIVNRGNQTILVQRQALEHQVSDLSRLLQQNEDLRRNLVLARKLAIQTNERLLHRVGAELHDGPAQLVGLALLYFDSLSPHEKSAALAGKMERFETVRGLLQDGLGELRNISADIAPPELERLSAEQSLALAIRNHERRTGVAVKSTIDRLPAHVPIQLKTVFYRFVQEGLNNAFRHAKGADVSVSARFQNSIVRVEVADGGPGFERHADGVHDGLGIAGLVDRIEACDGIFEIASQAGQGTRLIAQFEFNYQV